MEWGKIFTRDLSYKGLIYKINKEPIKLNTQKMHNPVKMFKIQLKQIIRVNNNTGVSYNTFYVFVHL